MSPEKRKKVCSVKYKPEESNKKKTIERSPIKQKFDVPPKKQK